MAVGQQTKKFISPKKATQESLNWIWNTWINLLPLTMFTRKLSLIPYPKAKSLGITGFPYYEFDSNGNTTYYEDKDGYWERLEYDSNGNQTYCEDSYGGWVKSEYDSFGNRTYYEDSYGEIVKTRI